MFLQRNLLSRATQSALIANRALVSTPDRGYFSVFDKLRDRFNTPLRHIRSFTDPDGYNYQS